MTSIRTEDLDALFSRWFDDGEPADGMVDAVVSDGWPGRELVEAGLRRHRQTWQSDSIVEAVRSELRAVDGSRMVVEWPDCVAHIWPGLPGAGVTPVLLGAVAGVDQRIRPPSGSGHLARWMADTWSEAFGDSGPAFEIVEPGDDGWLDAELVVASGSDETIDELIRRRLERNTGRPRLIGYGHGVSLGVVPDLGAWSDSERVELAYDIAADVVLWHQQGCFSARGLLVGGAVDEVDAFATEVGRAIARREREWNAVPEDEGWVAQRAKQRGLADFRGTRRGDGFGWAQLEDDPFSGELVAPHVATIHRFDPQAEPMEILQTQVDVPAENLQGAALAARDVADKDRWMQALARRGFTRICQPGDLQAPPAGWWHDGRPNILDWLNVTRVDAGDLPDID